MEQLKATSGELHATIERLQGAEADRLEAAREAGALRQQLVAAEADRQAAEATLRQRCAQSASHVNGGGGGGGGRGCE